MARVYELWHVSMSYDMGLQPTGATTYGMGLWPKYPGALLRDMGLWLMALGYGLWHGASGGFVYPGPGGFVY